MKRLMTYERNKIIQLINLHSFISCLQKWISFFGNPTTGRVTVLIHLFCIIFPTAFIIDKNSTESFLFRTIIKSKHTISNSILGYKVHFNNFFNVFATQNEPCHAISIWQNTFKNSTKHDIIHLWSLMVNNTYDE